MPLIPISTLPRTYSLSGDELFVNVQDQTTKAVPVSSIVPGVDLFSSDSSQLTVMNLSATDSIYTNDATIHNNLTITGNLSVFGDSINLNTLVTSSSALSVINFGTGPGLYIEQRGTEPIAYFIDSNGDDIIFDDNGYVGLGVTSPEEKLTVVGNISASGSLTVGSITASQIRDTSALTSTVTAGGIVFDIRGGLIYGVSDASQDGVVF